MFRGYIFNFNNKIAKNVNDYGNECTAAGHDSADQFDISAPAEEDARANMAVRPERHASERQDSRL